MIKKLLLIILICINLNSFIYADGNKTWTWFIEICKDSPKDKINCPDYEIKTEIFSPGNKKILKKARDGNNWNTVKSANAILWTIMKNLIIAFWVLSLLMMTIGWWMMIFHSGQESILTRWKWMFIWWVASLAIWLSAGLIVKMVSYVLY
jgi:hypothetical protein